MFSWVAGQAVEWSESAEGTLVELKLQGQLGSSLLVDPPGTY